MLSDKDPLTGARRNDILMSPQDAARLALRLGDPITLRNELGEFHGHVRIDPIKPGCLEAHWPEVNFLIPPGRLDTSGIPDYSATVEVVRSADLAEPSSGREVREEDCGFFEEGGFACGGTEAMRIYWPCFDT